MMMKGRWKEKGLGLEQSRDNEVGVVGFFVGVEVARNDDGVVNHS